MELLTRIQLSTRINRLLGRITHLPMEHDMPQWQAVNASEAPVTQEGEHEFVYSFNDNHRLQKTLLRWEIFYLLSTILCCLALIISLASFHGQDHLPPSVPNPSSLSDR
jgi:hypothetical protein